MTLTGVWERLYVGSRADAERLFRSNPNRITSVVSLCEQEVLRQNPSLRFVHVPIADAAPLNVGKFRTVLNAIAQNIQRGAVLIHCHHGVSRAPIMTASWMHVVGYKTIDAALLEIKELRPFIDPSSILLASVKEFLR